MATTMNVKLGTKTWSDAPAEAAATPQVSKLTETQKQQLGAENLGEVLNKVSDPNWVDPSKKVRGAGNNQLDKDAFFKLMLTQLKNQDPMNPLKNHEMAAQLAQFSTLEQLSNMNSTLTKMEGKSAAPENFQALNLIGKSVAGDSSRVVRTQFDKSHDFTFNLPAASSTATIKVMNAKGAEIRNYKLSNLQAGNNKISWNGQDEGGNNQPAGEYHFSIEAMGNAGQKIAVKTDFSGTITGLSFTNEGPVLQVGNQSVKMKDVRQISDPHIQNNDQNVRDVTNLDLKNNAQMQENSSTANTSGETTSIKSKPEAKNEKSEQARAVGSDVMTDVAMAPELMAQLQKQQTEKKESN